MKWIKKNESDMERKVSKAESAEELREDELENISGGFGEFEGLQIGEMISTPLKEKVKAQETFTEMTKNFIDQSKNILP